MRLTLQTDELKNALNKVLSVVDKKNTRPILAYTLIKADADRIEITATDLEVSAKVIIRGNVENPGVFCVNAKNLFDILKELPSSEINIELLDNENSLKLSCGKIHYSLLIYKSEDYPQLSFSNVNNSFNLSADQIVHCINKTSYAISTDETRPYLNGLYFQEVDSKLRVVATDGHRLSLIETELQNLGIEQLVNGIILPKKGVGELKKLSETFNNSSINFSVDDSFLYANVNEEYYLSIRLIAREYPKYQAVIPNKTTFTMTAEKNSIFDAVRRIKIMSNEKSNGVKVNLENSNMTVSANHPSLGDATETTQVEYDGDRFEIGFNAKYLIDTLSTFDEGEISLEFNNELSPIIIKSAHLPNYLGIIMPLKL